MAKYETRRRGSPAPVRARGFLRQVGFLAVSFVVGYFCASVYDYTQLSAWVSQHVLAGKSIATAGKTAVPVASLPKPKFEFYTLLTQDSRTGASVVSALPTTPVTPAPQVAPALPQPMNLTITPAGGQERAILPVPLVASSAVRGAPLANPVVNKEGYLVQLASFRRREDAERMKAVLILKGFETNVTAVMQQDTHWYRVLIGPFTSRIDAQRAQGLLARRERIVGMIRKMDA